MVLTMLIWGVNIVSAKIAVAVIPPLGFGFVRYLVAGSLLFMLLRRHEGTVRLPRADLPGVAVAGAVGIGLNQVFFLLGIHLISVGLAAIILATSPLITACMAALWSGEPLGVRSILALVVSFGGVVVVIAGGSSSMTTSWLGGLFILGAATTMGLGAILAKRPLRTYTSLRVTSWMALFGGITLLPVGLPPLLSMQGAVVTPAVVAATAFTILGATVIGQVVWNHAIKGIGAARTTAYTYLQPVVGIVVAAVLLGERLYPSQFLGGVMVLLGLTLYTTGARARASSRAMGQEVGVGATTEGRMPRSKHQAGPWS